MLPTEQHPVAIRDFLAARSGQATSLRLATGADSEFILGLRLNPARRTHISATSGSLSEQRQWMAAYKARFEAGLEAYFIIQHEAKDVGTVRLYDYRPAADSFCWGSWIIQPGASERAAFATPLIVYDLGFDCLGFAAAHFDIRQENVSVWKFEEMMGAELIKEDELNRVYTYPKPKYPAARARLLRLIGITA
jgi:RimJ/RimL family protein N-acetyltransferase